MTELEALQNAVECTKINELSIHQKFFEDKRKAIKKYFLQFGNDTLSPVLDYDQMNHFILGLIKAKRIYNH